MDFGKTSKEKKGLGVGKSEGGKHSIRELAFLNLGES